MVLFADILGFKRLVLENKTPLWENLDFRERLATRRTMAGLSNFGNPLSDAFKAFHGTIESLLDRIRFGTLGSVAVFSDSVFVASESHFGVLRFAEELMSICIGMETPLRMGVGYGSFITYGSSTLEVPGLKYRSSQFFGSGIIHATTAESSITGLRIGLHRSTSEALNALERPPQSYKRVPIAQALDGGDVTEEWNYLGNWEDNLRRYGGEDTDPQVRETLLNHINRMHARAPDVPRVQEQYAETKAAFARMAEAVDAFLANRQADSRGE